MTEASEGQRITPDRDPATGERSTAGSGSGSSGSGSSGSGSSVGTNASADSHISSATGSEQVSTTGGAGDVGPSKAVVGPFTLRELIFGGGVALVFLGTLLPFIDGIVRYANFWNSVSLFFVGIGILLPVVAFALLATRRLGSTGLRVGSLSVDQFASVSAVLAATFFFLQTVTAFHPGPLVALIGSLGMLAATVAGPFVPVVKDDFVDRPEVPAHYSARPITAARPRPPKPPKPPKPAESQPAASAPTTAQDDRAGINPAAAAVRQNGAGLYAAGGAGVVGAGAAASGQSGIERGVARSRPSEPSASTGPAHDEASTGPAYDEASTGPASDEASAGPAHDATRAHQVVREDATRSYSATAADERARQETITATRSADEEAVVEAFWFAVGSPRPIFDEQTGREVFTLQPGDWEVGIEDRGREFLVQDKRTGAVGILRDLRNIERAPRD